MTKKLTPWFPRNVKPVRRGVYRARTMVDYSGYAYWDGARWGWVMPTLRDADKDRSTDGASQDKSWRGLAKKPASNVKPLKKGKA